MDWLSEHLHFADGDLGDLRFVTEPSNSGMIETITMWRDETGASTTEPRCQEHDTEESFRVWAGEVNQLSRNAQQSGVVIVIYPRLIKQAGYEVKLEAKALRCSKQTFCEVAAKTFQHWSLSLLFKRRSTAVINSRWVTWNESSDPSHVYNCRSGTEFPTSDDDIAMSVTYFPGIRLAFASIYGCDSEAKEFIKPSLIKISKSNRALHPLLLPMVFAEFECKRLLNIVEKESTLQQNRIAHVEEAIRGNGTKAGVGVAKGAERYHNSISSWKAISSLKNGLESLKAQLSSMLNHLRAVQESLLPSSPHRTSECRSVKKTAETIEARLQNMILELESKVRDTDRLLGTMTMATQVEWNYYARRDSQATIVMASASQRDSSQMKVISVLGMIFLPPTLLASVFSMQFFDWSAPEASKVVSPWASLYVALSAMLMAITLYIWRRWVTADSTKHAIITPEEEERAIQELKEKAIWAKLAMKGRKPSGDDSIV